MLKQWAAKLHSEVKLCPKGIQFFLPTTSSGEKETVCVCPCVSVAYFLSVSYAFMLHLPTFSISFFSAFPLPHSHFSLPVTPIFSPSQLLTFSPSHFPNSSPPSPPASLSLRAMTLFTGCGRGFLPGFLVNFFMTLLAVFV